MQEPPQSTRVVYGLVRDMAVASQIVKYAKQFYSTAQNFDRAEALLEHAREVRPFLVILDLEHCEREAFQVLNEMRQNADLRGVPKVGFVTREKEMIKPEAEKAGCFRVYKKTEFGCELPDLITRYAI